MSLAAPHSLPGSNANFLRKDAGDLWLAFENPHNSLSVITFIALVHAPGKEKFPGKIKIFHSGKDFF
ncbi:MAG: hypothetical protein IPG76_21855 [Acidobacteria bacterium]|nr:hypothetical protein [Acidobacteriota bacterium]